MRFGLGGKRRHGVHFWFEKYHLTTSQHKNDRVSGVNRIHLIQPSRLVQGFEGSGHRKLLINRRNKYFTRS